MLVLAQLSDLHVDRSPARAERVRRVVDHLLRAPDPPDAVLVTGDVADTGDPAQYAEAAALLAPLRDAGIPVHAVPGNHDERVAFREALGPDGTEPESPAGPAGPVDSVIRVGDLTVVLLDSSVPGQLYGRLDPSSLKVLRRALADAGGRPVVVVLHHPPVAVGIPAADAIGLRDPEALAELLSRRPEVAGVLAGHVHTAAVSTLAGHPVVVGPAVAEAFPLPWDPPGATAAGGPPGFALHLLHNEGRLTSHLRFLPG